MLKRFKNVMASVVGGNSNDSDKEGEKSASSSPDSVRFPYTRPDFLQLSIDEVQVSADHISRPILVPREIRRLPWNSGYAEVINAGKTKLNEDQARAETFLISKPLPQDYKVSSNPSSPSTPTSPAVTPPEGEPLPLTYFAIFDGHAGTGAAVMAVNLLHEIVQGKLAHVWELLVAKKNDKPLPATDCELAFGDGISVLSPTLPDQLDDLNANVDEHLNRAEVSTCDIPQDSNGNINGDQDNKLESALDSTDRPVSDCPLPSHVNTSALERDNPSDPNTEEPTPTGHIDGSVKVIETSLLSNDDKPEVCTADPLVTAELQETNGVSSVSRPRDLGDYGGDEAGTVDPSSAAVAEEDKNTCDADLEERRQQERMQRYMRQQEELQHIRQKIERQQQPKTLGPGSPPPHKLFHRRHDVPNKLAKIDVDGLIVGALEASFFYMDDIIAQERKVYRISGGCAALTAVFFMGKLFVANAGDSRAVLCRGDEVHQISTDFTPGTDRQRIQMLAELYPGLLHEEFTPLEFSRRVTRRDIGKRLLFRNAWMTGWAVKTVTDEDTKVPIIHGEGKRTRLLATIGVARGFGDHDLRVYNSDIYIKPFLTCTPEVKVFDLSQFEHGPDDVVIMGSDGLWDVTTNEQAMQTVRNSLAQFDTTDKIRYTSAAQELVMSARGLLKRGWRKTDDLPASGDDITAFVIPLCRHGDYDHIGMSDSGSNMGSPS